MAGEQRGDPQVLAQICAVPWLGWSLPVRYLHCVSNVLRAPQ
jgi:hypothetical protein